MFIDQEKQQSQQMKNPHKIKILLQQQQKILTSMSACNSRSEIPGIFEEKN